MRRQIKNILNKIIPAIKTDKHGFNYTVRELVSMYESAQEAVQWHGEVLSNDILKYKTSDTVFILGSGPSINEISENQWQQIRKHDSIGFNYWFVHDFVPTMYLFQFSGDNLFDILKDKNEAYKNIPFIIRGSKFAKEGINMNNNKIHLLKEKSVYYLREYPIAGRCSIDINLLLKYMNALGFMEHGKIKSFIPKFRSTITLILMLVYQMGYKKIILCGVDMKNSNHFWDSKPYSQLKNKYSLPEIGASNIDQLIDKNTSYNTIPRYICALRDWFYCNNNVEIFILSQNTLLYPNIKLYEYL